MNTRRLVVILLAAVAAGGAALIVRGLLGGGTPKADANPQPAPIAISEVLVAASNLQPGQPLNASQVRWQKWPTSNIDPGFITQRGTFTAETAVAGTVVRAPIVAGEPITYNKIVKSDAAGFMSATLQPGMRAVSIGVSVVSIAGGFVLPNDRVDIILAQTSSDASKAAHARTVLSNVRVLAIDQAFDGKNQKAVTDVKTVTLELTPGQAEAVARAQASGTLSLALRALGDNEIVRAAQRGTTAGAESGEDDNSGDVAIIRYGVTHGSSGGTGKTGGGGPN